MRKKPVAFYPEEANENETLVEYLGTNPLQSGLISMAVIKPENKERKQVEVSHTISGKPQIIFEYNEGEQYVVDIVRLWKEVEALHYANTEATTDIVGEAVKKLDTDISMETAIGWYPSKTKKSANKVHRGRKVKPVAVKQLKLRKGKKA